MDDRKLLYSLMEGVLIIYNEQKAQNETKEVLHGDNFTAGPFVVPWRLIILMLTVWFLTILTWATFTLHLGKISVHTMQENPTSKKNKHSKQPYAPNYHTHFHCNCNGRQRLNIQPQYSNEVFFENNPFDMDDGHVGGVDARVQEADPSQNDSADVANMQIATNAEVYEISL